MADEIKVLIKEPGHGFYEATVPNTLGMFQALVDGYIETVPIGRGVLAIVDDEGTLKGKPVNGELGDYILVGVVVVVGQKGEEFADVPGWYVELVKEEGLMEKDDSVPEWRR